MIRPLHHLSWSFVSLVTLCGAVTCLCELVCLYILRCGPHPVSGISEYVQYAIIPIHTLYASRPTSTTATHGRSPARGRCRYCICLDRHAAGFDPAPDGSGASGSPTSVSAVQESNA